MNLDEVLENAGCLMCICGKKVFEHSIEESKKCQRDLDDL